MRSSESNIFATAFRTFCDSKLYKQAYNNLVKNLDRKSTWTVSEILKRYSHIVCNNVVTVPFSKEEMKMQKSDVVPKKYHKVFRHSFPLEPSVFAYHNGLVYVPKKVVKTACERVAIDGGGYMGDSAYIFATEYGFSQVYSFEPDERRAVAAKENCNGYPVIVEQSKLQYGSIDRYVRMYSLRVGCIKLDIEGGEYDVIRGARKTIQRDLPILLIALYHDPKSFFLIKPYIEKIAPGYTFLIRKLNPYHHVFETFLIAYRA